jgi:mannose-6-phosphate isomerase-like protein (cupin superfamily)
MKDAAMPPALDTAPTRPLFEAALAAARDWHAALPEARTFCDWPDDLTWRDMPAAPLPASDLMVTHPGTSAEPAQALLSALQALAPHLDWRHTYTAEEVGQHFLDHYGWFELAGPEGHFLTGKARITVGYWGPGLNYARHQHEPEELYTIVSGSAVFHADGEADVTLGSGGTRFHGSNQPHAMTTRGEPLLALVFWRGAGLADPPRMTVA